MEDLRNLDDAELVILAKGASTAAFEAIYDRHSPGVARALASFAGSDRDLLDDLVQDVFLRVVKGFPKYQPSHPFPHWLFTIALNVGRNHARRGSPVVSVNPSDLENMAGSFEPSDPSDAVSLMGMVPQLPMAMREVVSLRVGSDLLFGEIGELLGIPEGTARSRMHSAIRILRGQFCAPDQPRSLEHE